MSMPLLFQLVCNLSREQGEQGWGEPTEGGKGYWIAPSVSVGASVNWLKDKTIP